jgi:CRISPR-associated RAMP protein (TIGR02581 family)
MPGDTTNTINRYELRNRYLFTGRLEMQTALHIGGGRITLSSSNSPVVLTPDEKPFIPGSSFKGALRSTIEKLVPNLPGLRTCGLPTKEDEKDLCPTAHQSALARKLRGLNEQERAKEQEKERLLNLCHTCLLFGSQLAAARINLNDLYVVEEAWSGIIQIRDGVAIDRDSEKAKDRLKYDFEVVPAQAVFDLSITLENATPQDLQLTCVGLSEFVHGFGAIGGKRSRGLGACRLNDLKVSSLELEGKGVSVNERNQRLKNFLLKREFPVIEEGSVFLDRHIQRIFDQ